jgi:hypothetical protein
MFSIGRCVEARLTLDHPQAPAVRSCSTTVCICCVFTTAWHSLIPVLRYERCSLTSCFLVECIAIPGSFLATSINLLSTPISLVCYSFRVHSITHICAADVPVFSAVISRNWQSSNVIVELGLAPDKRPIVHSIYCIYNVLYRYFSVTMNQTKCTPTFEGGAPVREDVFQTLRTTFPPVHIRSTRGPARSPHRPTCLFLRIHGKWASCSSAILYPRLIGANLLQ